MELFKRRDRVLGVDLGVSSVKVIELSRSGQRYKVEALAIESFPEGAIADRNPADLDQVGDAIKRALKTSGTRLRKAAAAVPTSSVVIRAISMPIEFSEEDVEANIKLDASQYVSSPLEEIHLDFEIQGPSRTDPSTQDVVLVASRRENVDLRQEVLQDAGLKPKIMDVETYALENTFSWLTPGLLRKQESGSDKPPRPVLAKQGIPGLTAVADIGAKITVLYIIQDGKVLFSREQNFGADQLTTMIADRYELPKEKAELAKRSGDLPDDYQSDVLEPFQRSMADQIHQALQFFFASEQYGASRSSDLDGIILLGGGALLPGIDIVTSERVGLPVISGNPFAHMSNATRVNRHILMRDAPRFAIACGLALRSFD